MTGSELEVPNPEDDGDDDDDEYHDTVVGRIRSCKCGWIRLNM